MKKMFSILGKFSGEDLYFYRKDRELINKIKKSEQAKQKRDLALQNAGHCTCCGESAELREWDGVTIGFCESCEHVSISLDGLDDLITRKKLKSIVVDEIIARRPTLSEGESIIGDITVIYPPKRSNSIPIPSNFP